MSHTNKKALVALECDMRPPSRSQLGQLTKVSSGVNSATSCGYREEVGAVCGAGMTCVCADADRDAKSVRAG